MTVLSNIITPSNVLTTTNTATVTNKTLTAPTVTGMVVSDGTANGVTYLNGSKVLTSGSALVFDGTTTLTAPSFQATTTTTSLVRNVTNSFLGIAGGTSYSNGAALLLTGSTNADVSVAFLDANSSVFRSAQGGTEYMRLTSTGLGIGTSNPLVKLDVQAATAKQHLTSTTGTNSAYQGYFNTGNAFYVGVDSSTGGNFSSAAYASVIWSNNAYPMIFATNNAERARITSAGNFGVGTDSPGATIEAQNANASIKATSTQSGSPAMRMFAGAVCILETTTNNDLIFRIDSNEAARINTNGNLLINTTSQTDSAELCVRANFGVSNGISVASTSTGTTGSIIFRNPNGEVGSIQTSGSATSYNTSSDYRLKNTIAPMTGALAKVALLKPVTYKWNVDGSDGQGFIAHELAEFVPQAVTGEKDAVDKDGNPKYQGIDTSFLVATLTAAIQEQQALITQLQADVATLKGN